MVKAKMGSFQTGWVILMQLHNGVQMREVEVKLDCVQITVSHSTDLPDECRSVRKMLQELNTEEQTWIKDVVLIILWS